MLMGSAFKVGNLDPIQARCFEPPAATAIWRDNRPCLSCDQPWLCIQSRLITPHYKRNPSATAGKQAQWFRGEHNSNAKEKA